LSRTRGVVEEDGDRILLAAESSIVLCREVKPGFYEVGSLSTESRKIEPLAADLVDAICVASGDKIVAVGASSTEFEVASATFQQVDERVETHKKFQLPD
jgi:hypothetical protein